MRRALILLAALGLVVFSLAMRPFANLITVPLTAAWTAVPLPESPLGITEHAGKLWVTGANEMIAVSDDAGHTWSVKNHTSGEMLFFISFLDDKNAIALGSGHERMQSKDGGATWKEWRGMKAPGLQSGDFADAANGIAALADGWAFTHNGGGDWDVHGLPLPPDPKSAPVDPKAPVPPVPLLHTQNRQVLQVAAADATHAAILFAPEAGTQPWAFTTDGGAHWAISDLSSQLHMTGMRVETGKFWIYGTAPDGQPAAINTANATLWTKAPPPSAVLSDCNRQGCRAPGGWDQLDANSSRMIQLPPDPPAFAATSWAASQDTFCQIGDSKLVCAIAKDNWTAPATPVAYITKNYLDVKIERWSPIAQPGVTYDSIGPDTHEGTTILRMVIGTNGHPESVQVVGAAWADLAKMVATDLKSWHFGVVLGKQDAPVEYEVDVPYVFVTGMNSRVDASSPVASHTSCCF